MTESTEQKWFFSQGGQQGPVAQSEMRQMLAEGKISGADLVWRQGLAQWMAAREVGELADAVPAAMPLPPAIAAQAIGLPYASYQNSAKDIGQDAGMRWLLPVGRSGWAIAAGYLGLFSILALPAPLALIVSVVAIMDIKRHPNRHGMGRAIFGLVMGIIGTVFLTIGLFVMMASPHTRYR